MYFVYILQSEKDGSYYAGMTTDLEKRLEQHNWHETKSTSPKAPYRIAWFCSFLDKHKALDFEKYLKSSSGHAFRNKRLI